MGQYCGSGWFYLWDPASDLDIALAYSDSDTGFSVLGFFYINQPHLGPCLTG
jgi:hypothetical protein